MGPNTSMKERTEDCTQVATSAKTASFSELRANAADIGAVFAAGSAAGITSDCSANHSQSRDARVGRVVIATAAGAAVAIGYGAYCLWKWLSDD